MPRSHNKYTTTAGSLPVHRCLVPGCLPNVALRAISRSIEMDDDSTSTNSKVKHNRTMPLSQMVHRCKENSNLEACYRPFQNDVYSPPKRKRAKETVRVRTFSNDCKSSVSELEQGSSSDCLTAPHLSDQEHRILPQDLHERASKCSIVQTGSGCEALMKQPSFFDVAITEYLSGNGISKARSFSKPSQSLVSQNSLLYHTPTVGYTVAAASSFKLTNQTEHFQNIDNKRDLFKQSGYSPYGTAASLASDDTQSPISTPFRFTSFPASLPRINPKPATQKSLSLDELPSQFLVYDQSSNPPPSPLHTSSANRYTMSSKATWDTNLTSKAPQLEASSTLSTCMESETSSPGRAKAVDVSRDSTISSISSSSPTHGSQILDQPPMPHVSTPPLDLDPSDFHKVASGGEWDERIEQEEEEDTGKLVSGTRLNFNSLFSPEAGKIITDPVQELDSTLLSRNYPVELKRTFSSDTQEYHQNDGLIEAHNGVSWMQIDLNWPKNQERQEPGDSMLTSRQYFESQLASTQVSPIRLRGDSIELSHCSSLEYAVDESQSTQTTNFSSWNCNTDNLKLKENETILFEKRIFANSSNSSSTGKQRKIRPMPDMSAFDGRSSNNIKLSDDKHSTSISSLSSPICPPTPMLKLTRRVNHALQSNKVLVDCNQSSLEGVAIANVYNNFSWPSHNPTVDLPRYSSPEDEFDEDIANANFGRVEQKKVRENLNEHGISFNEDFFNLGILGSGAFADVFKVRCRIDDKLYAVKRRRRKLCSIRDREHALKEVRVMHKLQCEDTQQESCPYLLKLYRAWQEEGYFFCQTELCCRDNCHQLIHSLNADWEAFCKKYPSLPRYFSSTSDDYEKAKGHIIPESSIWKICHDVAAGLSHIHSCGIVHYDIKPCNIFFYYSDSEGCICRIGDFGLADILGSEEDGQEGDTSYMALELLSSNVKDASADIFSLGMTLYELSSESNWGLPTEGIRWREIRAELHDPELPASRSQSLRKLVKRMLSPNAKTRPSANFMLSSIEQVKVAGSLRNKFLEDYVKDANQYEIMCERHLAAAQNAAFELRKTPTSSILASHSNAGIGDVLRTPTPTSMQIFDFKTFRR